MLNRLAVHLWADVAGLPATVDDDGNVRHLTEKSREELDDALRPWMAEVAAEKDSSMAEQYLAMFGKGGDENNPVVAALRKQQRIIAGLDE